MALAAIKTLRWSVFSVDLYSAFDAYGCVSGTFGTIFLVGMFSAVCGVASLIKVMNIFKRLLHRTDAIVLRGSRHSKASVLLESYNCSLVGSSRQTKSAKDETAASDDLRKNVHARQMTSLERLSSSLVDGSRRSISPDSRSESSVTYAESDEPDSDGKKRRRKRERKRSIGSMPGPLDDIHFFGLDDHEEEEPVFGEFDSKGKDGHREDEYGDGEVEEDDVIADEQALEEDKSSLLER